MAGTAEVTDFRHAADRRLLPDRRHFLLIQGPFGPFFRRLATALEAHGATVTKIHLNGCDVWDWGLRPGAVRYTGTPEGWSAWIAATLASRGVTDLVVYGDCQAYHRAAIEMARRSGVRVHVFEQGYLRPHWITLEEEGVNAYSRLPRDPAFFLAAPDAPAPAIAPTGNVTRAAVAKTIAANLALYAFSGLFPGYRNPYFCAPARQAVGHTRRYFRTRVGRRWRDARIAALIEESRPFYLALMQRPGDSQLTCHSDYHAADDFAEACIASFARHAPPNTRLVFKCHPLDPGLHDHVAMLDSLARKHDVTGRVIFVDGGVLADMLRKTNGVITVNSTAGLTAVEFGRPTITLGRAIYDMPGLTFQGSLDRFWTRASRPDEELYAAFRREVIARTQINGSFWTPEGITLALEVAIPRLLKGAVAARPAEGTASPFPELETARAVAR